MKRVITYGTFDLLHYGHINLLRRAKALGDYLIVGITSDDFDRCRGKINVRQPLMERVTAVSELGIADEIIIEEYEGQKINDIQKYDIQIFTVGSDWTGMFDYLNEYCQVVYLERTKGVSSSEIRGERRNIRLGIAGDDEYLIKFYEESQFVNGLQVTAFYKERLTGVGEEYKAQTYVTDNFDKVLDLTEAVYIHSYPQRHYELIKRALQRGFMFFVNRQWFFFRSS